MQWRVGFCGKCNRLLRRCDPADFAVCDNGHPIVDVSLTFEFSEEDQRQIQRILRRFRRQRKKLGNPNDVSLSVDSIIAMSLLVGLENLRRTNLNGFLEACEIYGIKP